MKSTYSMEIVIFCKQKEWWASKIGHFQFSESIFEAKTQCNLSDLNIKLVEQLLLTTLLVLINIKNVYLVKMCQIFDGSTIFLFTKYHNFLWVCWFRISYAKSCWFLYPSFENSTTKVTIAAIVLSSAVVCKYRGPIFTK